MKKDDDMDLLDGCNQVVEFHDHAIEIYFIESDTRRFNTPKRKDVLRYVENLRVNPLPWKSVLNWFLHDDCKVPLYAKKSIERIGVSEDLNVFCVETRKGRTIYEQLYHIAKNTGWYFYVTGVDIGISPISKLVDSQERKFSEDIFRKSFEFKTKDKIHLIEICSKSNSVCFLLKIGNSRILLDAGGAKADSKWMKQLKKHAEKLDAIFVSHAHYDHVQGLEKVLQEYPEAMILCSQTTLDFYSYRNSAKDGSATLHDDVFSFSDSLISVIGNSIIIQPDTKLSVEGGCFRFLFAGHMPGALMMLVEISGYRFLYTGDFSLYTNFPIAGAKREFSDLPKNVDFALIDGAMSDVKYPRNREIFELLLHKLKMQAEQGSHTLIAADPASTGLILYLSIFNYFRQLHLNGFEFRPLIVMGRDALEYARIIQFRKEDLHPVIKEGLERNWNPFRSAIGKFCSDIREVFSFLKQDNVIFIFGPPDLGYGIIQSLFMKIGSIEGNFVYLAGAPRSNLAVELSSGTRHISMDSETITINAEVFNVKHPTKTINLHADINQIKQLVTSIKPKQIGLFHSNPRNLIQVRADFSRIWFVEKTYAFTNDDSIIQLR